MSVILSANTIPAGRLMEQHQLPDNKFRVRWGLWR